jgi:hypothetical protein
MRAAVRVRGSRKLDAVLEALQALIEEKGA